MKTLKQYIKESLLDDEDKLGSNAINKIKSSIKKFLKDNYSPTCVSKCKILDDPNEEGKYVVDCRGDLIVTNKKMVNLTNEYFVFGKVKGSFLCNDCIDLTSLEGAPREVGEFFNCSNCNSLTSLEGAPEKVDRLFNAYSCEKLTSLKGAPEVVGNFYCYYCRSLTSLKDGPKNVNGDFECSHCGKQFTKEDVLKVSKVKGEITV